MYNLISEQWIPVRRMNGVSGVFIAPAEITSDADNPVIALDAPRPDFNGALIQLLIGLVQTAYPPADERDWQKKFRSPPSPDLLKKAFERYSHAFNLDGEGPRFMQDLDLAKEKCEHNAIDHLLMEMPGAQTLEKNTDHFLKRETVNRACRKCSTMALFSLQTNAPSGGRGHRTSLRGGGPLTTIVMGRTLWETVWLNVLTQGTFAHLGNAGKSEDADIFPWMGETRTSAKNEVTTSQHVHPAQMFWGMPRRIRLAFEHADIPMSCDLCGCEAVDFVSAYNDKSYGTNYKGGWRHTLSPYYTPEKTGESLPIHLNQSGISYRNWLGLVQASTDKNSKNEPAKVVHLFRQERAADLFGSSKIPFRLWAFGYDMDNMKARGWYEGRMPLIHVDAAIRSDYEIAVSQMVRTASQVGANVRSSVKKALFKPGTEVRGDLSSIDAEFWQNTEPDFYRVLDEIRVALEQKIPVRDLKLRWLKTLSDEGEVIFDRYAQVELISVADPKRIALARRDFKKFSSPNNKIIQDLLDVKPTDGPMSGKGGKKIVSKKT
jgi:CRISPR system Cascade subunit CasA